MQFKNAKILCIFAHPDDESYIVGGTIALAARQGADITVISVTRGDKGFQNVKSPAEKERLTEIREQEMKNASKILGVREIILWDYPDGGLDDLDEREQELSERLKEEIKKKNPDMILSFGHDGVSGHRDHIAIGKLAVKAAKGYEGEVYGITYPKELQHYVDQVLAGRNQTVTHYVTNAERYKVAPFLSETKKISISDVIEVKFTASRAHKTQDPVGLIQAATSQPEEFWKFEYFLRPPLTRGRRLTL